MPRSLRPAVRRLDEASSPAGVATLRAEASDDLTDIDLVERAQGGDRWAEEVIYRRHVSYIGKLVVRLIGRRHDAEDVMQEIFAIALEHLRSLRDGAALRAWLTQIAVSRAKRRLQRRRLMSLLGLDRTGEDATLEHLAAATCSPEIRAELGLISDALARLGAEDRVAWTLHCVEGFTAGEAARACGCSLATIKRRIARATSHLDACVSAGGVRGATAGKAGSS